MYNTVCFIVSIKSIQYSNSIAPNIRQYPRLNLTDLCVSFIRPYFKALSEIMLGPALPNILSYEMIIHKITQRVRSFCHSNFYASWQKLPITVYITLYSLVLRCVQASEGRGCRIRIRGVEIIVSLRYRKCRRSFSDNEGKRILERNSLEIHIKSTEISILANEMYWFPLIGFYMHLLL